VTGFNYVHELVMNLNERIILFAFLLSRTWPVVTTHSVISTGHATFLVSSYIVLKDTSSCMYLKRTFHTAYKDKGKGKSIPLQPWTGPEGSRRFRLPDFKTIST
jgi:hypothetical protein